MVYMKDFRGGVFFVKTPSEGSFGLRLPHLNHLQGGDSMAWSPSNCFAGTVSWDFLGTYIHPEKLTWNLGLEDDSAFQLGDV